MTHVFRYSVPFEITVRVDSDDPEKAELTADERLRDALSSIQSREDDVTILPPVDLAPAYETQEEA